MYLEYAKSWLLTSPHFTSQGVGFSETPAVNPLFQAAPSHVPSESAGMVVAPEASQPFVFRKYSGT